MKTMFVSGFYNRFAKIQLLLVLAFNSLVPSPRNGFYYGIAYFMFTGIF